MVTSMAAISSHLGIDRWFIELVAPVLMSGSLNAWGFLAWVILLVCGARLFVRKSAVVTFFTLTLVPLGQNVGIHPGVVLLTIVMASECFFLAYQDGPYQIAYSSTSGLAFSHSQARKILVVKCLATFIATAISIPYWRMLGLIGG
jgi:hypothetical protein